ncbi:hypothetical protein IQ07DRAFT_643390 [Pyrenochaeta sp. DS3sAY3a]|nr:hypothetical protein IQ07DRAFT_643390 [Pyrenochaeta sp. DS3sAY3a]
MAKSARASSKKANRTKLRARVFGPAEKARAERLHAKLLETIQQPKPEKTDMDIAEDTTTEETKDEGLSKGSFLLTAPIPTSLTEASSQPQDSAKESRDLNHLYFCLGLSSDIVGFSEEGDLQFAFDPLPPHWLKMEIDGAATTTKKSSSKDKSQTRKQLRRKTQNKISFPTSRGKGALKPYSGSRVGKRRS